MRTSYTFLCVLSTYFYKYFLRISISTFCTFLRILSIYFYAYVLHISIRTLYTFPKPLYTPLSLTHAPLGWLSSHDSTTSPYIPKQDTFGRQL